MPFNVYFSLAIKKEDVETIWKFYKWQNFDKLILVTVIFKLSLP